MKKDCILVLDIDGTLTDSVSLHQQALLMAMQALRLPRLNTDWGSYPQHTDSGIIEHALAENGEAACTPARRAEFERDLDTHFAALLATHGLREIAGARALTEAAAASRWGVVFATGAILSVSRSKLRSAGIAFTEELLITSSEYAWRQELVAAAVSRARQVHDVPAPLAVTSVGDGVWDLRVANALGLHFVGVGGQDSAAGMRLRALGATVLDDLRGLIPALDSIDLAATAASAE
ncbi:HAD family hydrolase [Burkholderia gladioli]|uniref:HAD family hydrolase n=1 Tax=Burkholderia gladioli TaxID=28095 RepID=UPI00163DFBDE|nr:HAD family hydrolase [Burkholderia gladioli]